MKRLVAYTLLVLSSQIANAQSKTFPVGTPVVTQALFCFDQESAKIVADNKGDFELPEVKALIVANKCAGGRGVATYVREVYRNGDWAVWELQSGNLPPLYEATDWKPRKNGVEA
jgi:hypothetical protein